MAHLVAHALLLVLAVSGALAADPPLLAALGEDGRITVFRADLPGTTRVVTLTGCAGPLVGMDTRPADGRLYGLTRGNDVTRIDLASGACAQVSTLTVPFDGGARSGIDFTPQLDRLRLVSADGQNLRVNVTLGAVAVDTPLAFAPDDPNAGRRPRVTAAAYATNVPGTPTTELFEIDAELDVLVVQDPPNDGILRTVGPLGLDFGPFGGFEIVTVGGRDQAFAASGDRLLSIDLASGRATLMGTIGGAPSVISLAEARGVPAP